MKRRLWIALAAALGLAAVAAYAVSPLFAVRALIEAGRTGDRARLERLVDFPAVRASLQEQLNARLATALSRDRALSEGPFGALGALLGPAVVQQVVAVAVTPEGIAMMARSGRAPLSDLVDGAHTHDEPAAEPSDAAPASEAAPAAAAGEPPRLRTRLAYLSPNLFRATTISPEAPGAPLGWVMERRGLMAWRLVRIDLPPA